MTNETLQVGQPRGLWVLFATEMWERFSYYGMRALLVLYLVSASDDPQNPGFGWMEGDAYRLYGLYTWAVYLTPIFGGMLADRFLGTHRSMLLGGIIIAIGHFLLALTELLRHTPGVPVDLQTGPGAIGCFMLGLFFVIVGTGFFKPCVAVMVGQLYGADDPRREGGHRLLHGHQRRCHARAARRGNARRNGRLALGRRCRRRHDRGSRDLSVPAPALSRRDRSCAGAQLPSRPGDPALPLDRAEWQRVGVILLLALFGNIAFWAGFEQAGSSLNVFAAQSTDRPSGASWTTPSPRPGISP